tara:strand:+ start:199 stop:333 length:135 start_codon:yes stop_codon:yes gene_type:complete
MSSTDKTKEPDKGLTKYAVVNTPKEKEAADKARKDISKRKKKEK